MLILAEGFLPTRGSWVLDAVFSAMFIIMLVLALNIWLARRGQYRLHRNLQISLAIILILAIAVFEIDVRFLTDWRELASHSVYYESGWVDRLLLVHLAFAIPTPFVWGYVVYRALRNFPSPPVPGSHSHDHRKWGWIAAVLMYLTGITGCGFYWIAFAC